MFKKIAMLFVMSTSIAMAQGDYIAQDAKIVRVTNTAGNQDEFIINVVGGTGVCTGQAPTMIKFKLASATSPEIFNRAFSMALMALSTGQKVSVYNYVDTACDNAVYIGISAN